MNKLPGWRRAPQPHPGDIELRRLLPDGFYLTPGALWGDHRALIRQRVFLVDRCVRDAICENGWLAVNVEHLLACHACAEKIRLRASKLFRERATPDIAAFRYIARKEAAD
jgi:hypothetical protein